VSDRGELVMIRTSDGEEPARLYAVPLRLVPFLEALRDGPGVYGGSTDSVITYLLQERIADLHGSPLLPADLVEKKRRELRGGAAALW